MPLVQELPSPMTGANVASVQSVAFTTNPTIGNRLIAEVVSGNSVSSTVSVSDTYGNAWAVDKTYERLSQPGNYARVTVLSAPITATGAGFKITITGQSAGGYYYAEAQEFSSIASSGAVDQAQDNATGNSVTSLSFTMPNLGGTGRLLIAALNAYSSLANCNISDPALVNGSATGVNSLGVQQDGSGSALPGEFSYAILSSATGPLIEWTFANDTGIDTQYIGVGVAYVPAATGGGAALASGASDASTLAGALTTAIKLLAAAIDSSSGSGTLSGFYAAAQAVFTASGALSTAILMAAVASDASSGSSALTNWSSVVLTAPLYSGVGSILDANGTWSNGAPAAGDTVYYDATYLTIEPDGEIVAKSNNFSALCQWNNGGTWSDLTIIVTPGFATYGAASTSALGALSTGIQLLGAAHALTNATAQFGSQIELGAAIQAVTSASANLATAIELAVVAVDGSSGAATITGTSSQISGSASDTSSGQAVLNTQVNLVAAAVSVMSALGDLATQIRLGANALSVTSVLASLNTQVQVQAGASDSSAAAGVLSTAVQLAAASNAATNAAAALITAIEEAAAATDATSGVGQIQSRIVLSQAIATVSNAIGNLSTIVLLVGNAQDGSNAAGALSTEIQFDAAAADASDASGPLGTKAALKSAATEDTSLAGTLGSSAKLAGNAQDDSTGAAGLTTFLDPDANAVAETTATGALGAPGSTYFRPDAIFVAPPEGFWPPNGLLPFGMRFQQVGEMLIYAIDWSEWLANRWLPWARVVPGDIVRPTRGGNIQLLCVTGGYTGRQEPTWPENAGAQVLDGGTVEWEVRALDDNSLDVEIATATWSASTPAAIGFSSIRTINQTVTVVTVDTTKAVSGTDYDISCQIGTTDERQKIGKFRLKVR